MDNVAAGPHLANDQASSQTSSADVSNAGAEPATPTRWPNQASDYILEIGVEEVPSKALYKATQQLAELATKALDGARIEHGEIHTQSTPRRLVLRVDKLATRTKPLVQKFRGPAAKIAYDEVGNLTDAGIGFAHKKGVAPEKLTCAEEHGTSYVFAEVEQYSKPTPEVLPALLETAIKSLDWPKSMHWGSGKATFIRPIRWILSLWGDQVIPLQYAGIAAGRATWGHHLLANQPFEVADTDQYSSVLGQAWVEGSARFRRQKIEAQIGLLEEKTNLVAHLEDGTDTLAEIVNLVESPTTLVGTFDQRYLQIPPEIIVDAITKHQRYLPLYSPDGKLSNRFLIVSNGTPAYASEITAGHERVVRPRLDDAEFFFQEDKQKPLVDYVDQLKEVVFHEKLGSLYDKTKRMVALAGFLADHEIDGCKRAALLAKADLVTSAVVEFTSLQGVLGYYYALASDEPEAVAVAIKEHYQPRFSGDCIPDSYEGKIVALADKLDSLAGLFAVGEAPTGSKDPFALRRSAIGVLNILRTLPQIDLGHALEAALSAFDARLDFDHSATAAALSTFLLGRLQVIAKEEGYRPDTIQAVLATGVLDPKTVLDRIATLDAARKNAPDVFDDLAVAYARANNLRDSALGQELDCALFTQPEQALYDATEAAESQVAEDLGSNDYKAALNTLAALRDPIDKLFEMVMIMDKDDKLKSNHLRLLNRFVGVFADVADFGLMAKK
ncbi:MAG: glycine--tRNA ligase subunit beta [Coriobacteriales bacterium]|nr:glycine--tRNA ligase subunit beta [Coriobacteriales bacterium]